MSNRLQTKVNAPSAPIPSFTSVRTGLLGRKPVFGGTPGWVDEFAESRRKPLVSQPPLIQPKLTINRPNDRYEQEADRVADLVMRMPDPLLQRQVEPEEEEELIQTQPLFGQITPVVQRQVEPEEEEEEEEPVQAKQASGKTPQASPGLETQIPTLRGSGQPLPRSVRRFFEPRFGHDFSQVRVHTDKSSAESARAVNARAYTAGRDIVFRAREYAPETLEGRRLIAHELTHVIQQSSDMPVWAPAGGARPAFTPGATRSGPEAGSLEEIQTRPGLRHLSAVNWPEHYGHCLIARQLAGQPMVQRDLAIEPPNPEAEGRVLTPQEMQDAIDYNNRVVGAASAGVIEMVRDVLGISPTPAVVDADLVNAVVDWQAMQGLTQDGKLGPRSAAPLFREVGAEGVGRGEVKSGPTYSPSGNVATTVAGGRETAHFAFTAEFEDDPANSLFLSCGELRQYIRWDATAAASFGASGVPHGGFPAGSAAGTWIEDRDSANKRYGHRSGLFSDPQSFDQYLDSTGARNQAFGHEYEGDDTPGGPTAAMAGVWEFAIQCVDVCNNDTPIGGNNYIRIAW